MKTPEDALSLWLAQQARQLGLHTADMEDADPAAVTSFARLVLEALAARGLIAGACAIGCWSQPRSARH